MWDFIKKIVGTKNDREIKRIRPYVDEIKKPKLTSSRGGWLKPPRP